MSRKAFIRDILKCRKPRSKLGGLGPETVRRILTARRERRITSLERLGVKGKRLEKVKRYVV
jgi:predicted DNA-binding helix-hairpin-helix protein